MPPFHVFRRHLSGAALLLVFTTSPVHGQDTSDVAMHVQLSDSVVVTASRVAEEVRLTGRRITVWTQAEIAALPVSSYDELLRAVGGVDVQSRGGFGVQSDLTLRGSTFNGVLVLLDGARLNDPMTGHFLADIPVPLSEIARIEVLRGPATALYGPDAIGGVVQLFTKTGLRAASTPGTGFEGEAGVQMGRHGLYAVDARVQHAGRRTAVSAAATVQESDGEPIRGTDGQRVEGPGGPVRTDFVRQAASATVARDLGGPMLYARAGLDDRDFSAYHFYTSFPSDTAREATSTYWAQARLVSPREAPTRWRVQVAAKRHEDTYRYNPQVPQPNRHTSRLLAAQAQLTRDLASQLTLVGGASGSARDIESNNLGAHDDGGGGAFVRARWQPLPTLAVSGSGRLDHDPAYGTAFTPQFYVAFNRPTYTLRGGFGRAVRAPNYVERYYNTALDTPPDASLGTPDLRAERAWSYEVGGDLYPAEGLALHATGFLRTTDNLIDYALTPGDTYYRASNILSVETRGVELEASYRRSLGVRSRVQLTASYTGLDADLGDVNENVAYTYAINSARHLLQGTATLTLGSAALALHGLWKERIEAHDLADASYGVVHLRAEYRIDALGPRTTFSAEVRNLFDRQYSDVFDAPMPGRWWIIGARVRL